MTQEQKDMRKLIALIITLLAIVGFLLTDTNGSNKEAIRNIGNDALWRLDDLTFRF